MPLARRGLLLAAAAATTAQAPPPAPARDEAWQVFKRRFLTADGRVVDTGNKNVSHTEGQGWGLLFAAIFDDRPAFDAILAWTTRTLARPGDALHSWRYTPGAPNPVADPNNATDGDLFIAFALTRAAARWHRPDLLPRAAAIAQAVLDHLVHQVHGRTLLAPGIDGFTVAPTAATPGGLVVNPSYYAFPALGALSRLVPSPAWAALRADGLALIDQGRFGAWHLPPDWLLAAADGTLTPAPGQPPRYGYDAVRVPLYLAWAGIAAPLLPDVATWWHHADPAPPPAWVDVATGATAAYPADPGMQAATTLAIAPAPPPEPALPTDTMDYYPAALCLLARVAWLDLTARR